MGKARHIFWQLLVLVLFLSVLGAKDQATDTPQPDLSGQDPLYVIQANDLLEIFVWKEPDLSRKVTVRPDGRISFPLVQDMQAAGLTPQQLKDQIENRLQEFIEAPTATVIVDEIRHYRIYVTGKVNNPGGFTMEKPITVLQALSLGGGFQEFADKSNIKIIRSLNHRNDYLSFHYGDVVEGKDPAQNILLSSGDVVVVP